MAKRKEWDEYPLVRKPGHQLADKYGFVPKRLVYQTGDAPYVISDDLGSDLLHHGYSDSRTTSSKSTFRRWTKEAGLVEKGNDRTKSVRTLGSPTQDVVRDVAIATQQVKAGYRPRPLSQFEE